MFSIGLISNPWSITALRLKGCFIYVSACWASAISSVVKGYISSSSLQFWIFSLPKLLINSFVVESSWRCFRHFQQTLQGGIRCPRPVPTQVKHKNPGIRRWGIARDMTVTLQIHPKSQLLINSHQTSAAEAPNMAGMANWAYRPWGGTICNVYVPSFFPLMLCIGGTTITTGKHQAWRFVHVLCLRLANKH